MEGSDYGGQKTSEFDVRRRRGQEHLSTRNPFRFVKGLFTKEKSGPLQVSKRELEDHLKATYTDNQSHEQTNIPPDVPPIHQCDDSSPK